MPSLTRASHRIAYDRSGAGPAVVLQHGLMSRRQSFHDNGFVAALARNHTVICIDALGHGESDKPSDPRAHAPDARADDLAAVLDAEHVERAHVVGYSMGGWIATAFAGRHPDRLRSVAIGGWDPVGGRALPPGSLVDFAAILAGARARAPEITAWITSDAIPALAASFDALADTRGAEAALRDTPAPVLLWAGRADPCHAAARGLAARLPRAVFRDVPGDHLEAMTREARASLEVVSTFLEA